MQQLRWFDYLWRVISVSGQFDFARRALVSLSTSPEVLRTYLESEVAQAVLSGVRWEGGTPEAIADEVQKFLLRLDQNELILETAIFETFMKDLYGAILRQAPVLLREDRQIPLGRLVAQGQDAIIEEEIEREVSALDRKSISERARYFNERLRVSWGPPALVEDAERAASLRNRILHEEPDEPVSPEVLKSAVLVALLVPGFACQDAAERYPSAFKPQERTNLAGRPFDRLFETMQRG